MTEVALAAARRSLVRESPVGCFLRGYFADTLKLESGRFDDDVTLDELGIDSVEIPGLVDRIAGFTGVELQMADFVASRTVGDLIARIAPVDPVPRPPAPAASRDRTRSPGALPDRAAPGAAGTAGEAAHHFGEFMNPHLAERLGAMHLDREYVRGEGLVLTDAEGRMVLDFTSQYGALPFGYNDPDIWRAVDRFRDAKTPSFAQVSLLGPASALAAKLIQIAPKGLARVTFANSGAEAIEAAIKLCRAKTGRRSILSTQGGFHGKTMGALSATGRIEYQAPFGLPAPGFATIPYNDRRALQRAFEEAEEPYAAFIVEPIQGEAGVIVPDGRYLLEVRRLCRRHGVLLVIDEVQTAFGRTGRLFATADEIEPDVLVLAKGLSGGLVPFGACLCRAEVYTREFALHHSSTFAGHGLGAAIGDAAIDILRDPRRALLARVNKMGMTLLSGLRRLRDRHPEIIADVRGHGLMIGVEFHNLRAADTDNLIAIASAQQKLTAMIASYLLNVHAIRVAFTLNNGNVMRVQPALTVSDEQCERFLAAFAETLDAFATRNIAIVYAGIRGRKITASASRPPLPRRRPLASLAGTRTPRFAFLYHPPDAASLRYLDGTFTDLPSDLQEDFARNIALSADPFVAAQTRYVSPQGDEACGTFIILPHTAERLLALSREERERLLDHCVALARDNGARVLGLGAFTSVISDGGKTLSGKGFAITSGNSLTVVAGLHQLQRALARRQSALAATAVAVVGAGGSIGRAMAILLAREARSLVCFGNPARPERTMERLQQVALDLCGRLLGWAADPQSTGGEMLAHVRELLRRSPGRQMMPARLLSVLVDDGRLLLSVDPRDLRAAQGVVAAASATRGFLEGAHLGRNAILCDLSRPAVLKDALAATRPDVTVVEGGQVALPHQTDLGPFGLPAGRLYACMAETVLLTFEGAERDYSIGRDLSLEDIVAMERCALRHGMHFV
jgi:acetylornithine/succinyldiaminopimelate/putrescine aminotransferase/predicted amino acid dehydrogenase/acyl carrier protein